MSFTKIQSATKEVDAKEWLKDLLNEETPSKSISKTLLDFFSKFETLLNSKKVKEEIEFKFFKDNISFNIFAMDVAFKAYIGEPLECEIIKQKLQYEGGVKPTRLKYNGNWITSFHFPMHMLPASLKKVFSIKDADTHYGAKFLESPKTKEVALDNKANELIENSEDIFTIIKKAKLLRLLSIEKASGMLDSATFKELVSSATDLTKLIEYLENKYNVFDGEVGEGMNDVQLKAIERRRKNDES